MQPIPDMAGSGAAMLGCIQMTGGALSSALLGQFFAAAGPVAMPAVMSAFALAALFVRFGLLPRRQLTDVPGRGSTRRGSGALAAPIVGERP